jgi:hypothetical protein
VVTLAPVLARVRLGTPWRWLLWFTALVGAANLCVLLAQARTLIHSLYLSADNAAGLVLPALAGHAPAGSVVNLGDHAWYESWLLMRATASLPGYRGLWEAAPFLLGLLGIAAVSACAWWALGRVGGLLCAVTLLATSEALRAILYVPDNHGLTILHAGVLCGALLFVYRRALSDRLTPRVLILVGLPLAVFTGVGITDQLLLISGLAPFALAPLLCWWRLRSQVWRSVSAFALASGALSVVVALLFAHVMRDQNVVHAPFPVDFVGPEVFLVDLQNLIVAFVSLGGGDFFGGTASGTNLLVFLAGVLILAALACTLGVLWRWGKSLAGPASPAPTHPAQSPRVGARELFVAFWGSSLVLVLAAFALTSVSSTASDTRYLIGGWAALAALLGVFLTTPLARVLLVAAVALFGVLNLRSELASGVQPGGVGPDQAVAGAIERFAAANGATVGYGSYWDASPVTWETHLRTQVYPIQACDVPTGWCQFYGIQISSWYVPRPHTRTFLLTDTRPGIALEVSAPPASFGKPLTSATVGEGLTVYIYNHDIAADLSP